MTDKDPLTRAVLVKAAREATRAASKRAFKSIADELGRKRGRPLADWEVLKLTENFMDELDRKLRSDGVIK